MNDLCFINTVREFSGIELPVDLTGDDLAHTAACDEDVLAYLERVVAKAKRMKAEMARDLA